MLPLVVGSEVVGYFFTNFQVRLKKIRIIFYRS